MTHKFTEKDLIKTIQKMDIEPTQEWKQNTLAHLRDIAEEEQEDKTQDDVRKSSILSLIFPMRRVMSVVLVLLVIVGFSFMHYFNTPQNKFQRHLARAQNALEELREYTKGKPLVLEERIAILPVVYAENTVKDEEEIIRDLVETVASETQEAVSAAFMIEDQQQSADAFEEINQLQDETVEVLEVVVENIEDEKTVRFINSTIINTAEVNIEIESELKRFAEPREIIEEEEEEDPEEEIEEPEEEPSPAETKPPAPTPNPTYNPPSNYKPPSTHKEPAPSVEPVDPQPVKQIFEEHGYTHR